MTYKFTSVKNVLEGTNNGNWTNNISKKAQITCYVKKSFWVIHHFCIKRYLSNFLSVLQSVVVFRSRHNKEQIAKIIRLLILTELTLSKIAVVCFVPLCSVCCFLNEFLTYLLLHAQCTSHILLRRIWLWTESRHVFPKNNLKSPIFWVSKEWLKWKPLWTVLLSLSLLSAYKDCLVLLRNF